MGRLAEIAEKFGDSLKPHHKEQFENSTLEDMQTELSDIQSKQDQTKTLMNMNRIEKFLSGMEDLSKALTAINNRDAGHAMAYVWGSIRFLLRVCAMSLNRDSSFNLPLWNEANCSPSAY
jgi:hypothetical protein